MWPCHDRLCQTGERADWSGEPLEQGPRIDSRARARSRVRGVLRGRPCPGGGSALPAQVDMGDLLHGHRAHDSVRRDCLPGVREGPQASPEMTIKETWGTA